MSAVHDPAPGPSPDLALPAEFVARLMGSGARDEFSDRAGRVMRDLSERLRRGLEQGPSPPARLGSYLIGPKLGRGGMGVVFRAVHATTGKVVAIKTARASTNEARVLHAEALALGGLDHHGIVQVFDHGEEGGFTWMAIQLIRGRTLQAIVDERWPGRFDDGRTPVATAPPTLADCRRDLGWCRDLARALHAMHARGFVHRDVKPANLMIADDGTPFVIDFGLSLDVVEHPVVNALAGTVPYMSPEQVLALTELDGRSDVYSLAASFYELLGGRRLVHGDAGRVGIFRMIAFGAAPPLSTVAKWMPRAFDCVFAKALAKDAARRYQTAQQFAEDLERVLAGRSPVHARESWNVWVSRRWRPLAVAVVALAASGTIAWRSLDWRAGMNHLRELCERGQRDTGEAVRALDCALQMLPRYSGAQDFQDVYGKALADFSPRITQSMFRHAALSPSNAVDATQSGQLGAAAARHLSAAQNLSLATRNELIVQTMFTHVRASRFREALAVGQQSADRKDERIRLLEATAQLLSGDDGNARQVAEQVWVDHENLPLDRLCCRGILLLEMTRTKPGPSKEALAKLEAALARALTDASIDRVAGNFLAGLLALTRLRLDQPAAAEEAIESRLSDAANAPEPFERPAMTIVSAVSGFRALVCGQVDDPGRLTRVVLRFREAAEAEPELTERFVREVATGCSDDSSPLRPAFGSVSAQFFDSLMRLRPRPAALSAWIVRLSRFAFEEWSRRNEWSTLLAMADLIAAGKAVPVKDPELDLSERVFWVASINVAGNYPPEGGAAERLQHCKSYHAHAIRVVRQPCVELDAALCLAASTLRPDAEDVRADLAAAAARLSQRRHELVESKQSKEWLELIDDLLSSCNQILKTADGADVRGHRPK